MNYRIIKLLGEDGSKMALMDPQHRVLLGKFIYIKDGLPDSPVLVIGRGDHRNLARFYFTRVRQQNINEERDPIFLPDDIYFRVYQAVISCGYLTRDGEVIYASYTFRTFAWGFFVSGELEEMEKTLQSAEVKQALEEEWVFEQREGWHWPHSF